ncbi:DUF2079 domain-containing protein [Streptacidiphilus sp. PB12-B1b]|uniref:DUF2079 domain-containing protein n=1 Tax=Streptacidiphilus sp. PB12-B1b TaxID=2705012 RepID=UPI0015F99F79|nr:DUF2079 domain-containing protein [Streptacidiphilus sp. PB12-B1b]QMU74547.1 DUF2079 domain-containing protein [Streptacidiphilus sp. PB12-B1b]
MSVTESAEPSTTAGADPAPDRPDPALRLRRRLRQAAVSPCTWLVGAAIAVYGVFAYHQYTQLQVGACDLGIFYQAAEGWAFHGFPYDPIKGYPQLGDHFSPVFLLLAPALWVDNSPLTLVFAQVVLVCSSAVPVYLVARRAWGRAVASALAAAYLASMGVQGSIAFPVHEVMFGAPIIAWALERALAKRWTTASLIIASGVFVKEDMGPMVIMFALFALVNRKWRHGAALIVWGAGMFVLTVDVIIPHFNPGGFTYAADYAANLHADNFNQLVAQLATHPRLGLHLLFDDPVKRQTWTDLLKPVAFTVLASPIALLGAPLMVTRMLSSRSTEWSDSLYYDMPLMVITFIGAIDGVQRLARLVRRFVPRLDRAWLPALAGCCLAGIALVTTAGMDRHRPLYGWLTRDTYTSAPAWVAEVHTALAAVPAGVEVRATNDLVIPLAARDTVTLVGSKVDRGDWAAVDTTDPQCPIGPADIPPYLAALRAQGFRLVTQDGPIMVLHRP